MLVVFVFNLNSCYFIKKTEGSEPYHKEDHEWTDLAEDISDKLDERGKVVTDSHEEHELKGNQDQQDRVHEHPEEHGISVFRGQ